MLKASKTQFLILIIIRAIFIRSSAHTCSNERNFKKEYKGDSKNWGAAYTQFNLTVTVAHAITGVVIDPLSPQVGKF